MNNFALTPLNYQGYITADDIRVQIISMMVFESDHERFTMFGCVFDDGSFGWYDADQVRFGFPTDRETKVSWPQEVIDGHRS